MLPGILIDSKMHSAGATLLLLLASCPLYEMEVASLSKHALQFPAFGWRVV